ncbi:HEPN domain-containing protein [Aminipila sp.]|uniref:HEPN domain-containing protein n=1 Tax=Aminipila sp. TaxID=2060095 RepID=UPI002897BDA8|nr:HEPN domain-containing protein [Aminipila sp.]
MSEKNLRQGQALAMQWVIYALQKLNLDIKNNGGVSKALRGDAKSASGSNDLDVLSIGCDYVVNFILPFALELALKSLLLKEGQNADRIHGLINLYNNLPESTRNALEDNYFKEQNVKSITIEKLLDNHKDDFINWRYLDNSESLKKNEKEMQLALCSILDICNS